MSRLLILLFFLGCVSPSAYAATLSDKPARPFLKDFNDAFVLPPGQLELSVDYLIMNDTVDVLDVRDDELRSVSEAFRDERVGDLYGASLHLNYGLFPSSTLRFGYAYRDIELSIANFKIHSLDFAWRQALLRNADETFLVTLDAGLRLDRVPDQDFGDFDDIERLAQRIDSRLRFDLSESETHYLFERDGLIVGTPKSRGAPEISLTRMRDLTPYVRLSAGGLLGPVSPSVFVEFGKSWIDSSVGTNFGVLFGSLAADRIPDDENLDREETYWKAGWGIGFVPAPRLRGRLEYNYIRISRENSLDFVNDNHLLRAELAYFVTDSLAIHLGGTYYRHLYNGVFPVLYNRFTQSGFDHDYGELRVGFTYAFGR